MTVSDTIRNTLVHAVPILVKNVYAKFHEDPTYVV
jgi:hypothetical protein